MIQTIYKKYKDYKDIFIDNIQKLKGSEKRIALAKTAEAVGKGGQSIVAKEFHVSRDTIRKGRWELETGIPVEEAFHERGRKKVEEILENLLQDITDIVDGQSQTDPSFKTTRLFTRLTVKEIRKQLILQKGYTEESLPTNQTLNSKINELGYQLKKVRKVKPLKKIEETDAIFFNLEEKYKMYKGKNNVVRLSIDTKDRVKVGAFSRGGYSRINA